MIIKSSSLLAGSAVQNLRAAMAACLGALYACVVCINPRGIVSSFAFQILVTGFILVISFGFRTDIFKMIICFWAVSFFFGGAALAVGLVKNGKQNDYPINRVNLKSLTVIICLCYAFIKIVFTKSIGKNRINTDRIITISVGGAEHTLHAIYDTGNKLKDPVTGMSAVIIDRFTAAKWFPAKIADVLACEKYSAEDMLLLLGHLKTGLHFGLIPYRTVSENGLMLTFRADAVLIDGNHSKDTLIGLAPNRLSSDGSIKALIG